MGGGLDVSTPEGPWLGGGFQAVLTTCPWLGGGLDVSTVETWAGTDIEVLIGSTGSCCDTCILDGGGCLTSNTGGCGGPVMGAGVTWLMVPYVADCG